MNLRYLMMAIAVALSVLTISGCQSGPSYDNRPTDGSGYGSGGGSGGY
ncbi:hypothetical protein [Pararhizobium sp. LjRoot238]